MVKLRKYKRRKRCKSKKKYNRNLSKRKLSKKKVKIHTGGSGTNNDHKKVIHRNENNNNYYNNYYNNNFQRLFYENEVNYKDTSKDKPLTFTSSSLLDVNYPEIEDKEKLVYIKENGKTIGVKYQRLYDGFYKDENYVYIFDKNGFIPFPRTYVVLIYNIHTNENNNIIESFSISNMVENVEQTLFISWKHSKHGLQKLYLDFYINPQMQNGLRLFTRLLYNEDAIGLCVKNYKSKYMSLNSLTIGNNNKLRKVLCKKIANNESVFHEKIIKEKAESWLQVENNSEISINNKYLQERLC